MVGLDAMSDAEQFNLTEADFRLLGKAIVALEKQRKREHPISSKDEVVLGVRGAMRRLRKYGEAKGVFDVKKESDPFSTGESIVAYCNGLAKSGTEHGHQRAFFAWLNVMQLKAVHPMARLAFAIPNGGKRDKITAGRLKVEGVKSGVLDICYPVALHGFHGLWIELKVGNNTPSHSQSEWAIDLRTCGHAVATCWYWHNAAACFEDYAAGRPILEEYK